MSNHVKPPRILLARGPAEEMLKNMLTNNGVQELLFEGLAKFYTNSGLNPTPDTPLATFEIADISTAGEPLEVYVNVLNISDYVVGMTAEISAYAGDDPTAEDLHGMILLDAGGTVLRAIVPFESPVPIDEVNDGVVVDLVFTVNREMATGFPSAA